MLSRNIQGLIFLWLATLLFSAANSVINKLGLIGATHLINGRNPISFCNVLFLGNLIAGIIFLCIYRKDLHFSKLRALTPSEWLKLSTIPLFSSIFGPLFYFLAIMLTSVINVVLISSSEIAWSLILGYVIYKEKPSALTLLSASLAIAGVLLTFFLHQSALDSMSMRLTQVNIGNTGFAHFIVSLPKSGQICAVLGAFFSIMGDQLGKKVLRVVPIGVYNIADTFLSAIIFFLVALSVFGWGHFADLFSPFLWEWMLVYGGIIIAFAVYSWTRALRVVSSSDLAISSAAAPVGGIVFAYLIVGEIPDQAQILGGIVIFIGIAIGLYNNLKTHKQPGKLYGFKGI